MIVRFVEGAWTADCAAGWIVLRGLLPEMVLCGEKLMNGSRIAWTGMVRYVGGAWTGHCTGYGRGENGLETYTRFQVAFSQLLHLSYSVTLSTEFIFYLIFPAFR